MKYSIGNDKLGKNCLVTSRPVGLTCPSTCYFLNNGCYAQKTEKRFPRALAASLQNIENSVDNILLLLEKAHKTNKSIRLNERGDLFLNGQLDTNYIENLKTAIDCFNNPLPTMWLYTHIYDKRIVELEKFGVIVYASVHNLNDYFKAKRAGFQRFAYIAKTKKKKGGSKDAPKYMEMPKIGRTLVCPEQRLGRKHVTCTGTKTTTACKWCLKGQNVVFLEH